jgi:hypothetical protein
MSSAPETLPQDNMDEPLLSDSKRKQKIAREMLEKDPKITNAHLQDELRLMGFKKGIAPDFLAAVRAELGVSGANARKVSPEERAKRSTQLRAAWEKRQGKAKPKAKKTAAKKKVAKKKKAAKKAVKKTKTVKKLKVEPQTVVQMQTHIPADMLKHLKIAASKMKEAGIFELTLDDKGNIKADVRKTMFLNIL